MASNPIGREAQPVTLPGTIPPMPAVARILSRYDRGKLAAFVTVAIDLLDVLDGDPEAEENPLEDAFVAHDPAFADMDSDGRDTAWPEWQTRGRHKLAGGIAEMAGSMIHEDAEDDDPDTEREQMAQDVPMLPVLSADHNIFTDRRVSLGISNMQTSYRTNGGEVRSADSGKVHQSTGWAGREPGMPV